MRGLLLIAAVAAYCGTVQEASRTPAGPTLSRYGITLTLPDGWRGRIEHGAVRAQGPGSSAFTRAPVRRGRYAGRYLRLGGIPKQGGHRWH